MSGTLDAILKGPELDAEVFAPMQWCVDGVIPEGTGLLVAPPKAGKSWLVAGIGLACAAGGIALGTFPVEARPVLYLALEDSPRRLQDRFRRLMAGAPIPDIGILTDPDSALAVMKEYFIAHHDDRPLVILDTFGKVMGIPKAGTNAYATDYQELSRIMRMQQVAPGSTLLIVHHTRKQESDDFVHTASGTTGLTGAADFVIALNRKRSETDAVLNVTGRDVPEDQFAVKFDGGLWTIDHDGHKRAAEAAERQRHDERTARALDFIRGRTETRPGDLVEHLAIEAKRASEILNRLAGRGLISKLNRGIYGPAECAETAEIPAQPQISFPHSQSGTEGSGIADLCNPHNPHNPQKPSWSISGSSSSSGDQCRTPRCTSKFYSRGLCVDCIRQESINNLVANANRKPVGVTRSLDTSEDVG